jgi:hypothetical protein
VGGGISRTTRSKGHRHTQNKKKTKKAKDAKQNKKGLRKEGFYWYVESTGTILVSSTGIFYLLVSSTGIFYLLVVPDNSTY